MTGGGPSARSARVELGLVVALGALVAAPALLAALRGDLLGHPLSDMPDHLQGAWWFGGELLRGRLPAETGLTHFPGALRLWYPDPIGALFMLAARPLGLARAWDLLQALQPVAAALAAYAMGRDLLGPGRGGLVPAAVVGASPYLLGLQHSGLSEYAGIWPVVLAVWATLRALGLDPRGRPPSLRLAALAGLLVGLCALQALYYGLFTALFAVCALPGRGVRARVLPLLVLGLVATPPCLGVAALAEAALADPLAAVTAANAPGWQGDGLPATDLLTFIRPGAHYFPDTPALGNPGILHVNYLGGVALLLGMWAAVRDRSLRPLLTVTLLYGLLCLGPALCWDGRLVRVGGQALRLPLALLYLPGSPLAGVHHPYRLVVALLPLLGLFAGSGAARLPAVGAGLLRDGAALVVVLEALLLSPAPWPTRVTAFELPAIYAALPDGPLLDWPPDATAANRRYQAWQTAHGQPIPYGVNVFLPEVLRSDLLVVDLLRALDDPAARSRNRDQPPLRQLYPPSASRRARLGELGFVALVLHREALGEAERSRTEALLRARLGAPLVDQGAEAAWPIR